MLIAWVVYGVGRIVVRKLVHLSLYFVEGLNISDDKHTRVVLVAATVHAATNNKPTHPQGDMVNEEQNEPGADVPLEPAIKREGRRRYYAVGIGRCPGVYMMLEECNRKIMGFSANKA